MWLYGKNGGAAPTDAMSSEYPTGLLVDHAVVVGTYPEQLFGYAVVAVEHQTDALDVTDGRSPGSMVGVGTQGHRAGLDHSTMRNDKRCPFRRQPPGDESQDVRLEARELPGQPVAKQCSGRFTEVHRPPVFGQNGGIESGKLLNLRANGKAKRNRSLEGAGYGAGYHKVVAGHGTEFSIPRAARKVYARLTEMLAGLAPHCVASMVDDWHLIDSC